MKNQNSTTKMENSTITNQIAEQLNSTLPTFNQLAKDIIRIEREKGVKLVNPLIWACGFNDRQIVLNTMNHMCAQMQGFGFAIADGDEWEVKDWQENTYNFNDSEFECLLKIMFCSWLNIGIIDETNSEMYYEFKSDRRVWKVLN